MKKILAAFVLLTLVFGSAFAQFKVEFTADIVPELFDAVGYTGDAVDPKNTTMYYDKGKSDFFTLSDTFDTNEMSLDFSYTGEGYKALFELDFAEFLDQGSDFWKGKSTFADLLTTATGDYYVQGTVGNFTGYVGNTADRGATNKYRFQNFSDFLRNKRNNFGILMPGFADPTSTSFNGGKRLITFYNYDANNLKVFGTKILNATDASYNGDGKTVAWVKANFDPITVAASGNLTDAAAGDNEARIATAVRVSGTKIADIVTFDVLYKIIGSDPTAYGKEYDSGGAGAIAEQPDGKGIWQNTIGVYAGLDLIENLGIGVGYTAYFLYQELTKDAINKLNGPVWSGVDLRFNYTGIENLGITFNNNVSFASVKGDKNEKTLTSFVDYGNPTTGYDGIEKISDSYFGMYNAVAATYTFTEELSASLQIGNNIGVYTLDLDGHKNTSTTNDFALAAFATYVLGEDKNVTLEGGLALQFISNKYEPDQGDSAEWGKVAFGIPLRIKIAF